MINRNEGAAMLCGFALARWIPGLFGLSRKLQPDFASVVMTNVGEVRRVFGNRFPLKQGRAIAGNVVIQGVDGIAPVRENTNLAIAFGTYGGEMIVHLNRNTQLFSESDADKLLASLVDRLSSLVQPKFSNSSNSSNGSNGSNGSSSSRVAAESESKPSHKTPAVAQ